VRESEREINWPRNRKTDKKKVRTTKDGQESDLQRQERAEERRVRDNPPCGLHRAVRIGCFRARDGGHTERRTSSRSNLTEYERRKRGKEGKEKERAGEGGGGGGERERERLKSKRR
jgi:hypothetical protein